mmetsp:Transcript_10477/g.44570  ORF Transcript_10477/g.44570 Transcript_10477/m.44570 type:complete len:228 (+) Transcript_10477:367-1050(+)
MTGTIVIVRIGGIVKAPAGDVLAERDGPLEHGIHLLNLRDVPPADVRVEAGRTGKHAPHVSHLADVPPRQVQVAEAIITPSVPKHAVHVRDLAHVPVREVARRERVSLRKHLAHARHARGVPPRDVLVEVGFVFEQILHVRHQRNVPVGHIRRARGAAVRAAGGAAVFARGHGGQAVLDGVLEGGRGLERTRDGVNAPDGRADLPRARRPVEHPVRGFVCPRAHAGV